MRQKTAFVLAGLALIALGLAAWRAVRRTPTRGGVNEAATHSHALDIKLAPVFRITSSKGPDAGVDSLVALAERDSEVRALRPVGLHHVAHSIGRLALQNNGGRPEIFARCRGNYVAGCYHGVIEAFFATNPPLDSAALASLCDRISPRAPLQVRRECAHGMGHGLMRLAKFSIEHALDRCDELRDGVLRGECSDGVFMTAMERELTGVTTGATFFGRVTKRFGLARDSRFCNRFEPRFQPSCWTYEPAYFVSREPPDLTAALHRCDAAPPNAIRACYAGFGRQAQGPEPDIAQRIAAACRTGRRDLAEACRSGAVMFYSDLTWTADAGANFCRTLPDTEKPACYRFLGEMMGLMQPNVAAAERECAKAEPNRAALCKTGAHSVL